MSDLISRADAIEVVKTLGFETVVVAIKALPSADAVSREFYEDAVKANIGLVIENRQLKEQIESADAVQGEWIDMEIHCNPYPPIFCVECSRCGYRVGRETFLENTFNFCPSCGAKMYKGGDSE